MAVNSTCSTKHLIAVGRNLWHLPAIMAPLLLQVLGCAKAEGPATYRESRGEVVICPVELSDPVVTVTSFIRLQDGSVVSPLLYYNQVKFTGLLGGSRQIEEIGKNYRTIGKKSPDTHRVLFLPQAKNISEHLFLVRTSYPKEVEVMGTMEEIHLPHDWQLFVVPAKAISPDKPLVLPEFKELQARKLSDEMKFLRQDLVKRHGKMASAARKVANTPVGQQPMNCDAPRVPGTYLKGCGEVNSTSTQISEPLVQIARFVELTDGSLVMPNLKYFKHERQAQENASTLQVLRSDGHRNKHLDLPRARNVQRHLLLIRWPLLPNVLPESVKAITNQPFEEGDFPETQKWTPWALVELPAEYVSTGKTLKFPSYQELSNRQLSEKKQKLLEELVEKYDAKKDAA